MLLLIMTSIFLYIYTHTLYIYIYTHTHIYIYLYIYTHTYTYIYEKNANHMAYEGFPHICPMWHNHMWGDPHSTNSLHPCDCATYANMRETLICHMTLIYLFFFGKINFIDKGK